MLSRKEIQQLPSGKKRRVFCLTTFFIRTGISLAALCGGGILLWHSEYFQEHRVFIQQYFKQPGQVGSVVPSSKKLAREMTCMVPPYTGVGRRILEVGAGTGAFTEHIIEKLEPHDHLDVVEYDPVLVGQLLARFDHHPQVHIWGMSVLDFIPEEPYDAIISGLPFKSFDYELVKNIIEHYKNIIIPGGTMSYFTYPYLSDVRKPFLDPEKKENLEKIEKLLGQVHAHQVRVKTVLRNVPPARVHHIKWD